MTRCYWPRRPCVVMLAWGLAGGLAGAAETLPPASGARPETTPTVPIKAATPEVLFDPVGYTCPHVVQTLKQGGEPAKPLLLWAHGYFTAAYDVDTVGALSPDFAVQLTTGLSDYCQKHPSLNLVRAVEALSAE